MACGSFVRDGDGERRYRGTAMGAGDADTVAGEDDGLDWWGIGRWIDNGTGVDSGSGIDNGTGTGVRNWRSVDSGIDNGIGVNAGVRIWRGIGFVINVSTGRDAGVGADDGCDWIGCDECGAGVRGWRCSGCGNDAGAWRRD
jgi:hypothetical protein